MAAVDVTSNHSTGTSFPMTQTESLPREELLDRGDAADEGHSVDAPEVGQWSKSKSSDTEEPNACGESAPQMSKELSSLSPAKSLSDESFAPESIDTSDNKSSISCQTHSVEERKRVNSYSSNTGRESSTNNHLLNVTKSGSKSRFRPSESMSKDFENPNVYWLNTEFDRLVSDKKKNMKTTEEMRKELKDIGLGDIAYPSSTKQKSVEDIMREYGLEPTSSSSSSFNRPSGLKTAWEIKKKYVNTSQNNETLLASKSEIDEVKTNGSSVDVDYSYTMRRLNPSSSFVHATASRENANAYSESKHISRTPSFAYHDFRNSGSSTNLEPSSSKANLDSKRFEERTINPALYFQRERERLQRLDSVINRTPRSSVTSIPSRHNTWDSSDSSLSSYRTMPIHRPSFLNMDQGRRFGDYGEAGKDWGNSSPVRAYLQQPSAVMSASKKYSPGSYQFESHENPVYRSSTNNASSTLPGRHYSRATPNPGKEPRTSVSKPMRAQSIPAKPATKHAISSDTRSSLKPSSKTVGESSNRGQKTSKSKLRQGKSNSTTSTKTKSIADVNKEDFVSRLMKNYSNSCVNAENESNFTSTRRDLLNGWSDSGSAFMRSDPTSNSVYGEMVSSNRGGHKIGSGKYKPYQQNVLNMDNKSSADEMNNSHTAPRTGISTAWPASFDTKKYSFEDESFFSDNCVSEPATQTLSLKNNTDGPCSYNLGPDGYESDSFMTRFSNRNTYSGNRVGCLKGETSRLSSYVGESGEDTFTDDFTDASACAEANDISSKTDPKKGKAKATKKTKSVPTKKTPKRK